MVLSGRFETFSTEVVTIGEQGGVEIQKKQGGGTNGRKKEINTMLYIEILYSTFLCSASLELDWVQTVLRYIVVLFKILTLKKIWRFARIILRSLRSLVRVRRPGIPGFFGGCNHRPEQ